MYKKRHINLLSEVNMSKILYKKYSFSISKSLIVGNLRFPVDTSCRIQGIYELLYMTLFKLKILYIYGLSLSISLQFIFQVKFKN
jgi:hypothetical protein